MNDQFANFGNLYSDSYESGNPDGRASCSVDHPKQDRFEMRRRKPAWLTLGGMKKPWKTSPRYHTKNHSKSVPMSMDSRLVHLYFLVDELALRATIRTRLSVGVRSYRRSSIRGLKMNIVQAVHWPEVSFQINFNLFWCPFNSTEWQFWIVRPGNAETVNGGLFWLSSALMIEAGGRTNRRSDELEILFTLIAYKKAVLLPLALSRSQLPRPKQPKVLRISMWHLSRWRLRVRNVRFWSDNPPPSTKPWATAAAAAKNGSYYCFPDTKWTREGWVRLGQRPFVGLNPLSVLLLAGPDSVWNLSREKKIFDPFQTQLDLIKKNRRKSFFCVLKIWWTFFLLLFHIPAQQRVTKGKKSFNQDVFRF